ncbi:MAG: thioredoxin domain-containing protein [Byssovorax sp.]
MRASRLAFASSLALAALAACSRPQASRTPPAAQATPAAAKGGDTVVAEVDGAPILAAELDRKAEARLTRLRQEEYEIRKQALDELVAEKLLAKEAAARKVSPEELVEKEVDAKAAGLSAAQVETIYEQNKDRFAGQSRAEAVERIRTVLLQRARESRRAQLDQELRQTARVAVLLAPPRAAVEIPPGSPATGAEDAPVTIVEFTDYQCPYCHRAQSTVEEVLKRYAGKVRLVHLDFPLEGHSRAFPAARAARCAGEQGRFWEYHRSLMTENGSLDDVDLTARAKKAGLDAAKFGSCIGSQHNDEAIRAAFAQGESLGVTGTPAYFINGRLLSGARPVESFAEVIDSELAGR